MESSDLFSSLLQNPDTMKTLAGIAAEVMGGMPSSPESESSGTSTATASNPEPPTVDAAPPAFRAELPPASSDEIDPAIDIVSKAMPVLSVIAQSGRMPVHPERVQLLRALKPFVSAQTSEQIDHAARILSMARMTKTAAEQVLPQLSHNGQEV